MLDAQRPHRQRLAPGCRALRDDRHERSSTRRAATPNAPIVPRLTATVHRAVARVAAVRVLSVTHGPSVPGGVFDEAVEAAGHTLERWQVPDGGTPDPATSYDAVMVFGGSQHPDQDDRFEWLAREEEFLQRRARSRGPGVRGVPRSADARARGRRDGRAGERAGDRMARRRAHTRGRRRPGSRRPPAHGHGVPVAPLHLRGAARRRRARAKRDLPAGVPPAAARVGDPVPRRGHAGHGRRLGRGGSGRPPDAGRRACAPSRRRASTSRTSRDGRSPRRSSASPRRASRYSDTARDHSCQEPT